MYQYKVVPDANKNYQKQHEENQVVKEGSWVLIPEV